MSLQTFSPPIAPDVGSGGSHQFRTLTANFGDGYEQEAGDGINTKKATYSLNWTNLTIAECDDIIDFFNARGGYEAFWYTLPGDTVPQKFRCKKFSDPYGQGNRKDLSAEFVKVYDL